MKKIGMKMSLYMALTLSFCLSLVGNLSSGHFSVPGFLISFVVSFVISLVIGFFIPMKPLTDKLGGKLGLEDCSMKKRLFDSLISDLIYTPVMTFIMVTMAYKQATAHGQKIPYGAMLGKSMVSSLIVGDIIILIVTPIFLGIVMKQAGGPPRPDDE